MGTEEFWIPAVLAAVGTGASAYNSISANQRSQASEAQGIQQQQDLRKQAAGMVNKTVSTIAQSNPQALTRQATGDFVNQLRTNEAGANSNNSGVISTPGANSRFSTDLAASSAKTDQFGDKMSGDLASMGAAVRQRQQEGLDMGTLQTNTGLIGAQAGADSFITQLRSAAAGQQNPWVNMGAGLLQGGAKAYSMNPGGGSDTSQLSDWYKAKYPNGYTPPAS